MRCFAMSTLAIWCHVVQFRDVSPHNFDGLAMSGLAISVATTHVFVVQHVLSRAEQFSLVEKLCLSSFVIDALCVCASTPLYVNLWPICGLFFVSLIREPAWYIRKNIDDACCRVAVN